MAHKLVIVESPAKARTIAGYLGDGYVVESSIGHIRDLPNNAADTPAKIKDKPWGRLAVDVDNGFTPYYVVPRDKKSHISKLKGLLKDADELYLATDEDREGEAIAWHLLDELKPKNIPVHRMVFHEITKPAIQAAVANPREINDGPRRGPGGAPDPRPPLRLRGQPGAVAQGDVAACPPAASSPSRPGWSSTASGSGWRFRVASYWDLEGTFDAGAKHEQRMFPARLHSVDGARVARGSDFGQDGQLKKTDGIVHLDRAPRRGAGRRPAATRRTTSARSSPSPTSASPYAPFRTTTLQQEASRKLGMSASVTMSVAQRLYENGFITYMRTDSTTLSSAAIDAARDQVAGAVRRGVPPRHARGPTPPRSRTPRRRTRRSARPATPSGPRRRPA